ncbi:hypothetical protein [Jidongwangia harbinensis]|uniref:hypothetical protein n=1 Tax=Jidongwangia harbinensis TaxID=2878561 RepID=UPI00355803BE
MVGEFDRAFSGRQLLRLAPFFQRHNITLWLPELAGPYDHSDPVHRAFVMLLGHRARSEVLKSRFRVSEAMRVQVVQEGRFVGVRPPYGYRLEDAGPHPNPQHAGWGRRRHRLAADPVTAKHVRWMYEQRLAGRSVTEIYSSGGIHGMPHDSSGVPTP